MEKIIMNRGYGKTTQLIKKSAISRDCIVCHSRAEVKRIQEKAIEMNIDIPEPITYSGFLNKEYLGKEINGFMIDNLEKFLSKISAIPINAVTMLP